MQAATARSLCLYIINPNPYSTHAQPHNLNLGGAKANAAHSLSKVRIHITQAAEYDAQDEEDCNRNSRTETKRILQSRYSFVNRMEHHSFPSQSLHDSSQPRM